MADQPNITAISNSNVWPPLPLGDWRDTMVTLHMWSQIVGKVRLAHAPFTNHWWHVPLYVSCRGLTTSPIPYGNRFFQIDFDFIDHQLVVSTNAGDQQTIALRPQSVANFYAEVMALLKSMGLSTSIWTMPVECADPIPFEQDDIHKSYDPIFAHRFWQVLLQVSRVFTKFRARYTGKVSPVNFYWGSFDLNVTRFSGRRAPPRLDVGPITAESYTHEVNCCGFWAGGEGFDNPAFYAYAAPQPGGYSAAKVGPDGASFNEAMGEFILPYEAIRTAKDPDSALLKFMQDTYEAGANLGDWPRADLEYSGLGYWRRESRRPL
nr:DUF5996 family protein [uncultured Sphingomonas sp.]